MAEKVFISYSHQDHACANGIARYLKRHGIDVWIDSNNLSLGDKWAADIDTALNEADVTLGILSSSSLRRDEVLRELSISLKRMEEEGVDRFRLFFVVIGQIHPSWFRKDETGEAIKKHLQQYQYIQLSAYGEVTIDAMKKLYSAINKKGIEESRSYLVRSDEDNGFINQNSLPEKAFDNAGNNIYYKVYPADLAPSTVYPFALDNQWLPEIFYDEEDIYYKEFEKEGFHSLQVREYLKQFKKRNFSLSFFHNKQVIVRLNMILYDPYFSELLLSEGEDKEAFIKLLQNGSLTILLNNDQMTPFIHQKSRSSSTQEVIDAWNGICEETSVYCIRENWSSPIDLHGRYFLRFCSNLAMDHDANVLLAKAMGIPQERINAFLVTLKTISMQSFCQTHMNGTQAQDKVDDYSRSLFYRNYIVKDRDTGGLDPVHSCLFDQNKPFNHELKRLIDIFYNSVFSNTLQCSGLLPDDIRPKNYYLHSLYLDTGEKEVSIEELQYAFSEFFDNCEILDEIQAIGSHLYLENWDLSKITDLRNKETWYEYVELLELIKRRSNLWKVDFNEIELLLQRFLKCFEGTPDKIASRDIAFSFRVLVGSRVLDIVKTPKVAKVKEYGGSYADPGAIPLKVLFTIGDLSREERKDMIFLPVTLFSGRIDTSDGDGFFNKLKEFILKQCGFVNIDQ
ncbi:MAG: toll/interleukin-1 receptor domain-containing protein [Erysipelotrichaceae bacterium]|nr:toll/interleukin-1 receptor domain-containing protein [Erysipelotrichaceae bacterium]